MSAGPDYTVSEDLLVRADFQQACRERDFGQMFRLMKQWDGVSQDRIAAPIEGLTQSRVSRIVRGVDRVVSVGVIERIIDGLHIPGSFLGLAPRRWESQEANRTVTASEPVVPVLPPRQNIPAASPIGELIDRQLDVTLDVHPDGRVDVHQVHHLENLGDTPVTGLTRQVWFKHVAGPLKVEATESDRNVFIKTIHDVGVQVKFSAQIFPAINPGEMATVGYTCIGGQFLDELYWRQTVFLPTQQLRLQMRLHGVEALIGCSAVEERTDGLELTATESLTLANDGNGTVIDLNRRDLRSNQSVTLRWDVPHETA
ncbi:helix-turn-helix domain-containing protein [Kineosporia sp. J2-2]|uniref:Helix-turn-helix domain-containing protein n=1 Tax=Kineosporia corallincola TaxID=2835133 RepID=A0ABS5TQ84_9ACTN|nr:helix-turn-helix domain-containing protein [Kineosporia corallincola]MBT0773170.1 helix-turn-helix domain-containing protein [Kineosporia corallincola]